MVNFLNEEGIYPSTIAFGELRDKENSSSAKALATADIATEGIVRPH